MWHDRTRYGSLFDGDRKIWIMRWNEGDYHHHSPSYNNKEYFKLIRERWEWWENEMWKRIIEEDKL